MIVIKAIEIKRNKVGVIIKEMIECGSQCLMIASVLNIASKQPNASCVVHGAA